MKGEFNRQNLIKETMAVKLPCVLWIFTKFIYKSLFVLINLLHKIFRRKEIIMFNNTAILLMLLMLSAQPATAYTSNPVNKTSELRLYATENIETLLQAEGMMYEVLVTAERPTAISGDNRKFNFTKLTDYLTLIANLIIIVFFFSLGIATLLSKWKQRKKQKKGKGPFSIPPFSDKNIDISKDYAC